MLGPWDIIPAHVRYVGHLDEVSIVVAGLLTARVCLAPDLVMAAFGGATDATASGFLIACLRTRRRAIRLVDHTRFCLRRVGARLARALRQRRAGTILFEALGYRIWWRLRSVGRRAVSESDALVVVGGSPRSGTTLLRTMLGRHSMIVSSPETTVFLPRVTSPDDLAERLGWDAREIATWQRESRSQTEFIIRFQTAMLERSGKAVWLEKTPRNVSRFRFVRRHFPRAKLIHIVRDGRDVVCSLRRTPFARLDHAAPDSVAAAIRCAVQWRGFVEAGLRMRGDPGYHELRYEDLVTYPERTLRALLAFLGLPWEETVLSGRSDIGATPDAVAAGGAIFDSSFGRWRHDLSTEDRRALGVLIGATLVELGYERGLDWCGTSSDRQNDRFAAPAADRAASA
jgi:hypothetical protein